MDATRYTIVSLTQRWYIDQPSRTLYREAWVRDTAGELRFVGIRNDLVPAQVAA